MLERRPIWLNAWLYLIAGLLVAVAVGPALWLALTAVQPAGTDLLRSSGDGSGKTLSIGFTWDHIARAWTDGKLAGPMLNSVLVSFARAVLNVLVAALAAYPLARMSFAARNVVFTLILATMMVPEQVTIVPMFTTVVGLGMYDTLVALIVPLAVSAFGIFLCRQAMMAVPKELEEAASIDGASPLAIWWHVMLPSIRPTLATLFAFSLIGAWSELLWPLVVLQTKSGFTLPVAVNELVGQFAASARVYYAAAVLALVPILVAFMLLQRFLKGGMFDGAVKG
jgi:putative chitobiose transport system permease protein